MHGDTDMDSGHLPRPHSLSQEKTGDTEQDEWSQTSEKFPVGDWDD